MRGEVKLFLPTSWEPRRNSFLEKLGVSIGGLGEHFFGNVYDAFFTHAVDVKSEFERYYSVEYADLAEYIEIRFGETLSADALAHKHIFLVTWIPQVVDENYEDNKLEVVLECIRELERSQHENKT
jgi:hypothetical protein